MEREVTTQTQDANNIFLSRGVFREDFKTAKISGNIQILIITKKICTRAYNYIPRRPKDCVLRRYSVDVSPTRLEFGGQLREVFIGEFTNVTNDTNFQQTEFPRNETQNRKPKRDCLQLNLSSSRDIRKMEGGL